MAKKPQPPFCQKCKEPVKMLTKVCPRCGYHRQMQLPETELLGITTPETGVNVITRHHGYLNDRRASEAMRAGGVVGFTADSGEGVSMWTNEELERRP